MNIAGKDNYFTLNTDQWGVVLANGTKYSAANFEIDSQKVSNSNVSIFDSFTKQGKVIFTIPNRETQAVFLDIYMYVNQGSNISTRFRDVAIY